MADTKFKPGHKESPEVKAKRIISQRNSWHLRKDYIGDIKNPFIYNSWRAIRFTAKGKKSGNSDSWNSYRNFYSDMNETWEKGMHIARMDINLPFSKENCIWVTPSEAAAIRDSTIIIDYNNEVHTIVEWAEIYKLSVNGIKARYHSRNNCSPPLSVDEILFGKKKEKRRLVISAHELEGLKIRQKASKMISSYKRKDYSRRYLCDLTIDWIIDNILFKECVYCGTKEKIGCDRIDNRIGHIKSNVVPCCIGCNMTRGDNYTYEEMLMLGPVIKDIKLKRSYTIEIL